MTIDTNDLLNSILESISRIDYVKSIDIPNIDLYMLNNKDVTGKEVENLLDTIGVTVNKNTVPNETRSPFVTSGIRIGTAAVTTRGFEEEDMKVIAEIIDEAIQNREGDLSTLREKVEALCDKHPLY